MFDTYRRPLTGINICILMCIYIYIYIYLKLNTLRFANKKNYTEKQQKKLKKRN
jgi:hypothetical protein